MAKLFLIRRNMESFTGPLSLVEMKEAYKRMAFGLQDEVSGHCGPWVSFDNLEQIKRIYPDVARIVHEDMLAGWGVSGHGERMGGEKTAQLQIKRSKGLGLAIAFAVIALCAFLAAVFMASGGKLSSKAKEPSALPGPDVPFVMLERRDFGAFTAFMTEQLDTIVDKVLKERKADSPWLPLVRRHAFMTDGTAGALPSKLMRGEGALAAPTDCSLKSWKKRWRAASKQTGPFVSEKKLQNQHWARLLAWDPHWVKRREHAGWIAPDNYYVGCLEMADRALTDVASEMSISETAAWDKNGLAAVRIRLQWVLEMARDGSSRAPTSVAAGDPLSQWTCYEAAKDAATLVKCKDAAGAGPAEDPWVSYTEDRFGWSYVRIAAHQKGALPAEVADRIAQLAGRLGKADYFTRFDYRAELKLAKTLGKKDPVPVEKIVEKLEAEFSGVKLSR